MNGKKALIAWTVLGTSLLGSMGCYQTHMAGMTLPSGHYMKDRAEYFTPMPDFPLPRELATMQRQAAEAGYYTAPQSHSTGAGDRFAAPPMPAPAPGAAPMMPAPGGAAGNMAPG